MYPLRKPARRCDGGVARSCATVEGELQAEGGARGVAGSWATVEGGEYGGSDDQVEPGAKGVGGSPRLARGVPRAEAKPRPGLAVALERAGWNMPVRNVMRSPLGAVPPRGVRGRPGVVARRGAAEAGRGALTPRPLPAPPLPRPRGPVVPRGGRCCDADDAAGDRRRGCDDGEPYGLAVAACSPGERADLCDGKHRCVSSMMYTQDPRGFNDMQDFLGTTMRTDMQTARRGIH